MNYSKIVPEDSFLGQYLQACEPLETASIYDFWCGMWTLGTTVGRGVYVPRPHAPVYMNWYIMLVAESGITRKSTAVRMARDIVDQASDIRMVEGRTTPELLWHNLSQRHPSQAAIAVSELVTFLGKATYMLELPGILTDLYDCPSLRRGGGSMSGGEKVLQDVFVTFLSASTPAWLAEAINPAVIEGGFTSRCLFVHASEPKQRVAWPTEQGAHDTALVDLLDYTCLRAQEAGEIHLMPAAMKRFVNWYKARDVVSMDPFISSFNSREDAHVLRAAACLAINDGKLAIYIEHLNAAIKLINEVKKLAVQLFHDSGVPTRMMTGVTRVVEMLAEAGPSGVLHTHLYMRVRNYLPATEFAIVMDQMHNLEMVTKFIEDSGQRGRKPVRYIRGPNLLTRVANEELKQTLVGPG